MGDTIDELYAKYTSNIEEALADDRYFQYLFEMIQAGDNTLHQTNRILHKVVDESWLSIVEDGIEAIFNIVDKPRRFITTSEEVVPVALAKKITADSVRHLSQNTQFIATNAAGEMQPTRILNVTTEESYDLYENRFVYHLIQRLFTFVDKRTDVIFWSTGDETCNIMSMESKIDDAYEEISYKVEMTVKNKQSLVENDADNMSVFKRIDRVRRMSRVLRTSSFCDIMNGCAKVHSPIQRTNLMMKDPDYRRCYKLWQFIESYDDVGYSIEEQDSAMEFDEEYLLQMYINMITNYTVFKSLLESDPRKMWEIEQIKKEPVKPKFVKEIKEEIVDNCDIPDVEIRKVFVEEVTQAQLDAEAALDEEKQRNQELEQTISDMQMSMSDLEWQLDSMGQQMQDLSDMNAQAEADKAELMSQLEAEKKLHQETKDKAAAAEAKAREDIEAARKAAEEAIAEAKADAAGQIEEIQKQAAEQIAQIKASAAAEVETAQKAADEAVAEAKASAAAEVETAQKAADEAVAEAKASAAAEVETAQKAAEEAVASAKADAAGQIEEMQKQAAGQIAQIKASAEAEVETAQKAVNEAIAQAKAEAAASAEAAQKAADEAVAKAKEEAAAEVAAVRMSAEEVVAQARSEAEAAQKAVEEARMQADDSKKKAEIAEEASSRSEQAAYEAEQRANTLERENEAIKADTKEKLQQMQQEVEEAVSREQKALAKAEANSLSHYIVNALKERRERKESEQDDK